MITDRINSDAMFYLKIYIAGKVLEIPGSYIGLIEAKGITRILRKDFTLSSCYEVDGILIEIHANRIADIEFIRWMMNKKQGTIEAIAIYYLEDDCIEWFDTSRASGNCSEYRITSLGDMRIRLGEKIDNHYAEQYETSPFGCFDLYKSLESSDNIRESLGNEFRSYDELIDAQTQEAMSIIASLKKHSHIRLAKNTSEENISRFVYNLAILEQYLIHKYHYDIKFINHTDIYWDDESVVNPRLENILHWMKKSKIEASKYDDDIQHLCKTLRKYCSVQLRDIYENETVIKYGLEGL